MSSESLTESLAARVHTQFPHQVIATHQFRGQETVLLKREGLLDVARFLHTDSQMAFDVLMDLTCVDYLKFGKSKTSAPSLATPSPLPYAMQPTSLPDRWERLVAHETFRFEVVYHLYSTTQQHRLRLKVPLTATDAVVDSLAGVWCSADWFEREVWDMFGVTFAGHTNLKRLLMYEAFVGHPLRKDYPASKRQPLIGPQN